MGKLLSAPTYDVDVNLTVAREIASEISYQMNEIAEIIWCGVDLLLWRKNFFMMSSWLNELLNLSHMHGRKGPFSTWNGFNRGGRNW